MTPLDRQIAVRNLAGLPWYARLIAYDLAARANRLEQCKPLQSTLAKDNGVSLATVGRAIAYLRHAGLLDVETGKYHAVYTLKLDGSATSHRGISYVSQSDRSSTMKMQGDTKPQHKPLLPGQCPRCRRYHSMQTGLCEACETKQDRYRRAQAQVTQ